MTPLLLAVVIAVTCTVIGIVVVTAVRRGANVGALAFVIGSVVLLIVVPLMMNQRPHETPPWMKTAKDWFGLLLCALYLIGLGFILVYIYAPAFESTTEDVGLMGITPNASAPTQVAASWLVYGLGVLAAVAGIIFLVCWIGSYVLDGWNWFTRPTARTLVANMQQLDGLTKLKEFNASTEPLFFTLPKEYMEDKSVEQWRKVADEVAKEQGKFEVKEVTSIKFLSYDGRNLTHAKVNFKGKKDGKDHEGRVHMERQIFPEDQDVVIGHIRIIEEKVLKLSPSSSSVVAKRPGNGKVSISVPNPIVAE